MKNLPCLFFAFALSSLFLVPAWADESIGTNPEWEAAIKTSADDIKTSANNIKTSADSIQSVAKSLTQTCAAFQSTSQNAEDTFQKIQESQAASAGKAPVSPASAPVSPWIPGAVTCLVFLAGAIGLAIFLKPDNPPVELTDAAQSKLVEKLAGEVVGKLTEVNSTLVTQLKPLGQISLLSMKIAEVDKAVKALQGALTKVQQTTQNASGDLTTKVSGSLTSFFSKLFGSGNESNLVPKWNSQLDTFRETVEQKLRDIETLVSTDAKLRDRDAALLEKEKSVQSRENENRNKEAALKSEVNAAAQNARVAVEAGVQAATKALGDNLGARIESLLKQATETAAGKASLETQLQSANDKAQRATAQAEETRKDCNKAKEDLARVTNERDLLKNGLAAKELEIRKEVESRAAERVAALESDARAARDSLQVLQSKANQDALSASEALAAAQAAKNDFEGRLKNATDSLEKEKSLRQADANTAAIALRQEQEGRAADKLAAAQTLAERTRERDTARERIYPAEFAQNPDFAPLLAELDVWEAEGKPGAALARASLAVFAQRAAPGFPAEIWLRALSDLSRGIAMAGPQSPIESHQILTAWKNAISKLGTGDQFFGLTLPALGAMVNFQFMRVPSNVNKVSRVLSWAVYDQNSCVHLAEIK